MVYKYGTNAPGVLANSDVNITESFQRAMIANANRGGENVAPGSLIGALLGASVGFSGLPPALLEGLAPSHRATIDQEIDAFVAASPFVQELAQSTL